MRIFRSLRRQSKATTNNETTRIHTLPKDEHQNTSNEKQKQPPRPLPYYKPFSSEGYFRMRCDIGEGGRFYDFAIHGIGMVEPKRRCGGVTLSRYRFVEVGFWLNGNMCV